MIYFSRERGSFWPSDRSSGRKLFPLLLAPRTEGESQSRPHQTLTFPRSAAPSSRPGPASPRLSSNWCGEGGAGEIPVFLRPPQQPRTVQTCTPRETESPPQPGIPSAALRCLTGQVACAPRRAPGKGRVRGGANAERRLSEPAGVTDDACAGKERNHRQGLRLPA